MKFTYEQLDPVGLAANSLEDAVTGVLSELRPLYPDNNMTSGDVGTLLAQLDNVSERLRVLRDECVKLSTITPTETQEH